MNAVAIALWVAGVLLIGLAIWRGRPIQSRLGELDRLAENARRYEGWRGGRKTAAGGGGESGADLMRAMLRRQLMTWVGVGALGVMLVVVGFFVR